MDVPPVFTAGQHAAIRLRRILTFTVLKLFLPTTNSAILVRQCDDIGTDPVVFRTHDPRYLGERFPIGKSKPWRPQPMDSRYLESCFRSASWRR